MLGATRAGVNLGEIIRLMINYLDQAGNFVDPSTSPILTILDPNNNIIINADSTSGVLRSDVGMYYYDFTIPLSGLLGIWSDMWSVNVNGVPFNTPLVFTVNAQSSPMIGMAGQELDPVLSSGAIKNVLMLMKLLRTRLGSDGVRRKRNEVGRYLLDRNGGFIMEPCNVFATDDLYTFLKASLAEFNSIPHFTSFTFDDPNFVTLFQHELTEGAFILAMALQGLKEKGREFQMTDDGLSYQPPMIADYLKGYLTDFMNSYRERVKFVKCQMKPNPIGFVSGYSMMNGANPSILRLRHLRSRQII